MATKKGSSKKLRVGSKVRFLFGAREARGTIVEDRGHLGVGGERILRVQIDWTDMDEPIHIEIPESELRAVA